MDNFKNYKDESRINYGTTQENLTLEQLNVGCLMRIADASEAMAGNYLKLQSDLHFYKSRVVDQQNTINRLIKLNASYRGVITRMKNKK